MIPTVLVAMPDFPLTINGKLDRSALPEPVFSSNGSSYESASNELEQLLCQVWKNLLGVGPIGIP